MNKIVSQIELLCTSITLEIDIVCFAVPRCHACPDVNAWKGGGCHVEECLRPQKEFHMLQLSIADSPHEGYAIKFGVILATRVTDSGVSTDIMEAIIGVIDPCPCDVEMQKTVLAKGFHV